MGFAQYVESRLVNPGLLIDDDGSKHKPNTHSIISIISASTTCNTLSKCIFNSKLQQVSMMNRSRNRPVGRINFQKYIKIRMDEREDSWQETDVIVGMIGLDSSDYCSYNPTITILLPTNSSPNYLRRTPPPPIPKRPPKRPPLPPKIPIQIHHIPLIFLLLLRRRSTSPSFLRRLHTKSRPH